MCPVLVKIYKRLSEIRLHLIYKTISNLDFKGYFRVDKE